MFNSVEYLRALCHERKIPVSQLEKACGFSNGYLKPRKLTRLPYDRAVAAAEYLGVSVEEVLTGQKESAPEAGSAAKVTDEDIKFALFGGDGEITDEMYEEVKKFASYLKQRGSAPD